MGFAIKNVEYPGDRAGYLSPAQTSSGRERPDFPLSRQVTIGGFIDPRKQSCFIRDMLVVNAASGSGEAVVNPSLNVVSIELRVRKLLQQCSFFRGTLPLSAVPVTHAALWAPELPGKTLKLEDAPYGSAAMSVPFLCGCLHRCENGIGL